VHHWQFPNNSAAALYRNEMRSLVGFWLFIDDCSYSVARMPRLGSPGPFCSPRKTAVFLE
jgi:hypothetical protein